MDELEKNRKIIDGIDKQMAALFEERMNAAKEIARRDDDERETKAILVAFVRCNERYDELRISDEVYRWARNYDGPIADEYDYRDLWNVNTDHLSDMLEEYIDLVDRPCMWS